MRGRTSEDNGRTPGKDPSPLTSRSSKMKEKETSRILWRVRFFVVLFTIAAVSGCTFFIAASINYDDVVVGLLLSTTLAVSKGSDNRVVSLHRSIARVSTFASSLEVTLEEGGISSLGTLSLAASIYHGHESTKDISNIPGHSVFLIEPADTADQAFSAAVWLNTDKIPDTAPSRLLEELQRMTGIKSSYTIPEQPGDPVVESSGALDGTVDSVTITGVNMTRGNSPLFLEWSGVDHIPEEPLSHLFENQSEILELFLSDFLPSSKELFYVSKSFNFYVPSVGSNELYFRLSPLFGALSRVMNSSGETVLYVSHTLITNMGTMVNSDTANTEMRALVDSGTVSSEAREWLEATWSTWVVDERTLTLGEDYAEIFFGPDGYLVSSYPTLSYKVADIEDDQVDPEVIKQRMQDSMDNPLAEQPGVNTLHSDTWKLLKMYVPESGESCAGLPIRSPQEFFLDAIYSHSKEAAATRATKRIIDDEGLQKYLELHLGSCMRKGLNFHVGYHTVALWTDDHGITDPSDSSIKAPVAVCLQFRMIHFDSGTSYPSYVNPPAGYSRHNYTETLFRTVKVISFPRDLHFADFEDIGDAFILEGLVTLAIAVVLLPCSLTWLTAPTRRLIEQANSFLVEKDNLTSAVDINTLSLFPELFSSLAKLRALGHQQQPKKNPLPKPRKFNSQHFRGLRGSTFTPATPRCSEVHPSRRGSSTTSCSWGSQQLEPRTSLAAPAAPAGRPLPPMMPLLPAPAAEKGAFSRHKAITDPVYSNPKAPEVVAEAGKPLFSPLVCSAPTPPTLTLSRAATPLQGGRSPLQEVVSHIHSSPTATPNISLTHKLINHQTDLIEEIVRGVMSLLDIQPLAED